MSIYLVSLLLLQCLQSDISTLSKLITFNNTSLNQFSPRNCNVFIIPVMSPRRLVGDSKVDELCYFKERIFCFINEVVIIIIYHIVANDLE